MKYKVVVNGNEYEMDIELLGEGGSKVAAPAPAPKAAAPAPKAAAPAPAPAAAAPAPAGAQTVSAPMPGKILSVETKEGAQVNAGDLLFILEAMKMENEIVAPCAGTVSSISVTAGANVETGNALCVIG